MFLNSKSAGKENRNRKTIFDVHIRIPFRFVQANFKKKSVIYTLRNLNIPRWKGGTILNYTDSCDYRVPSGPVNMVQLYCKQHLFNTPFVSHMLYLNHTVCVEDMPQARRKSQSFYVSMDPYWVCYHRRFSLRKLNLKCDSLNYSTNVNIASKLYWSTI